MAGSRVWSARVGPGPLRYSAIDYNAAVIMVDRRTLRWSVRSH